MKTWQRAMVIGSAVAVAVLAVAAIAAGFGGLDRGVSFGRMDGGMMLAADGDGSGGEGPRGCGGPGLMQDPQAREEMRALREEHRDEMRAWWDTYGDDPQSAEALGALETLREEHRADMLKIFEKYGVTPPDDFGRGGGGGCGLGGSAAGGSAAGGWAGPGGSGCGGGQGPGWGPSPSPEEGTGYEGGSL